MRFLDDKGRLGGKLSIVDLFVIVLIIACVAAVGLKLKASQEIVGGDRVITYGIRVENIREMSVNAINSNHEAVIDAENKKELGDIVEVKTQPARVLVQTNDGNFSFAEYDNRYDAVITVKAEGTETDDGYFTASGRQVAVGEVIGVTNGYSQFFGEIISVTVE